MVSIYILVFLISCGLLFISGKWMVSALLRIAKFLQWREFVIAFIIVAFASSIPNFFVGITSALYKIPQLSFGDVVGGNLVDLTIAVALATLFARGLPGDSKMVQTSALLTMVIAVLPLILILDGTLGRWDGILLVFTFILYIFWLFSRKERFNKLYDGESLSPIRDFKLFLKDIGALTVGVALLLAASQGIVKSASFLSLAFDLPLVLVGVLIVGVANCVPETYFAVVAARKGGNWMILGDLMGSVIVCATLVLGIVALIYPIQIPDFSPFAVARIFLFVAALFFFLFVRTERKISAKEAVFLFVIYASFVMVEVFTK